MEKKKLKKPTIQELQDLAAKVESEGFGYYMLQYGPDLDLIERMGYNRKQIEDAIALFEKLDNEIQEVLDNGDNG